jgi:hypothetical protein
VTAGDSAWTAPLMRPKNTARMNGGPLPCGQPGPGASPRPYLTALLGRPPWLRVPKQPMPSTGRMRHQYAKKTTKKNKSKTF